MRQISFSNFRRFEDFPPLTFGDITFLVGGNNCGKSTLVKALLLTFDNLRHIRNSWKDPSSHAPKFRFDANQIHDLHVGTFWRALNHHAASPLKAMRMTRTIVMRRFLLLYFSPSTMQKASLLLLITRNLRQLCVQMVRV